MAFFRNIDAKKSVKKDFKISRETFSQWLDRFEFVKVILSESCMPCIWQRGAPEHELDAPSKDLQSIVTKCIDETMNFGGKMQNLITLVNDVERSSGDCTTSTSKKGLLFKRGRRTGLMQKRQYVIRGNALLTYRDEKCTMLSDVIILRGMRISHGLVTESDEMHSLCISGSTSDEQTFCK